MLQRFSCRDLVTAIINYNADGAERLLVVCSAYLPYDSENPPPSKELKEVVRYYDSENLYLIVSSDSKAYHIGRSRIDYNYRRELLVEFINCSNFEVLNQGSAPNLSSGSRLEVIDNTTGYFGILESFTS
jgi:hypothetical protein